MMIRRVLHWFARRSPNHTAMTQRILYFWAIKTSIVSSATASSAL